MAIPTHKLVADLKGKGASFELACGIVEVIDAMIADRVNSKGETQGKLATKDDFQRLEEMLNRIDKQVTRMAYFDDKRNALRPWLFRLMLGYLCLIVTVFTILVWKS